MLCTLYMCMWSIASLYAWIIPLAPLLINFIFDVVLLSNGTFVTSLKLDIRAKLLNNDNYRRLNSHGIRLLFYLALFMFRTFVLYLAMDYIEDMLMPIGSAEASTSSTSSTSTSASSPSSTCWYSSLVGRCRLGFDISDHIILAYIHYFGRST